MSVIESRVQFLALGEQQVGFKYPFIFQVLQTVPESGQGHELVT